MSKIELPTITSGHNLSAINNNFQKIEDALNKEVLYRKNYVGEPNEMQANLDMNSKEILNVSVGASPGSLVTRGYVDQEIAEERAHVDQELAKKFDKSGGPMSGSVDMGGNEILNVSRLSTNTLEIGGVQAVPADLVVDPYNGTREALRRSYAEAGYNLVAGSFEAGGTVTTATDVLLFESGGKAYSWGGTLSKTVPAGSTPSSSGGVGSTAWSDRSIKIIRTELDIKTLKTFGATGGSDDSAAFSASANHPIFVSNGSWTGNSGSRSVVGMSGYTNTILNQINTSGNFLSFRPTTSGGTISDLTVVANKPLGSVGHQMDIRDGSDFTVRDMSFKDGEGTGFSFISYPSSINYMERCFLNNIRGVHNGYEDWANGGLALFVRHKFSIANNLTAKGYAQFGTFEYKDDSKYNIASNLIADNCQHAVYLGTESENFPGFNIITNVVANNVGYAALNMETSNNNMFSSIMADFSGGAAVQPHGVALKGNANVVENLYMHGMEPTKAAYPVRVGKAARNNYISTFAHYNANPLAMFEPTTTRNFVLVKHPGEKSDIFSPSGILGDRSTYTGTSEGNVLHSPATGQYFGTMSGRFEWRQKEVTIPGSTLFSDDKFRFIADGTVGFALGGGAVARAKWFTSDGTHRSIFLDSSQALKINTGASTYLAFGASALTPSQTNTYSLGTSSNALAGGFTQTAFTVLSDERCKTTPLSITDAILDAWAEVSWVQYQYLDRVEEKGEDGARWHFGVVAQRAKEAFERHGLNAHDFGFLCYDEWEATPEITQVIPPQFDTDGNIIEPERVEVVQVAVEAGDRYGIRYEEALALEAALQRRNYERLLKRVEALENK